MDWKEQEGGERRKVLQCDRKNANEEKDCKEKKEMEKEKKEG